MTQRIKWATIKSFITSRAAHISFIDNPKDYIIIAIDGEVQFRATVDKTTPRNTDQIDWEDNFKDLESTNAILAGALQSVPNKAKTELITGDIDLNPLAGDFTVIKEVTGKGKVFCCLVKFSSENVIFKFEIDNNVVIEIDCSDIADILDQGDIKACGWLAWNDNRNMLLVEYDRPFFYSQSFKISAKANSSSTNRKIKRHMLQFSEE